MSLGAFQTWSVVSTIDFNLLQFRLFHHYLLIFVLPLWFSKDVVKSFCHPSVSSVFIVQFSDFVLQAVFTQRAAHCGSVVIR